MLRLRPAAHPPVPVRSHRVLQLPPEADMLSLVPQPADQHTQPEHGEARQLNTVPVQVPEQWLSRNDGLRQKA